MTISSQEVENMIKAEIPDAQVRVADEGGKFQVRVVSDFFAGMNRVKRQQAIYRIVNPHIRSGAIHAISMQLLTAGEQEGS